MATQVKYIQFKGEFYDASNQSITGVAVAIQFYNTNLNTWVSLTQAIKINASKMAHTIEIPDRIATKNQTIRIVRETLKSGGAPSFRVIKFDPKQQLPEVLASNFKVENNEKKQTLGIDFGSNWLLGEEGILATQTHKAIASPVPVFRFENAVREIESERAELLKQHMDTANRMTTLQATITNLNNEKETLNTALAQARTAVEERDVSMDGLQQQLSLLTTQVAEETTAKVTLQKSNTALKQQVANLQKTVTELREKEGENYEMKYTDLQQKVADLEQAQGNAQQQKETFESSIAKLQEDLKERNDTINHKDTELLAKQLLIETLEQKTGELTRTVQEFKDFKEADHPNKLEASKVYGSIVKDVIKADEELLNSKYKLANVSLNLKTTVEKGPAGTMLGLLDFETAKGINAAAVSDISIDVVPNSAAVETATSKMPHLLGLTETAVRKLLADYELKLDAVYHRTDNANLVAGQSFKQSPAAETSIKPGQEVIVIFAKPLN